MSATMTFIPPTDHAASIAANRAADFPIPTGREEEWRFTPLAPLAPLFDASPASGAPVSTTWHTRGADVSWVPVADPRINSVLTPVDRLSAMATSHSEQVLVVAIPAAESADVTVSIVGQGGTSYGHMFIDVGADASANVIVEHTGEGEFAGNIEVRLGDRSTLTLVSVQQWSAGGVHAGHHHVAVGRDATFTGLEVTLSGDLVRIVPTVDYLAPGGNAELFGAYFADSGQHFEHRLFVDHAVPHCRSRVSYKGALQGADARSVWVGDVLIRAAAVGTDTYELNRNLILTDGARADSVPNLEIETGEVAGAGHASATGRFDDEQLFYLMSRGIDRVTARRLVVMGFFLDVLERIPDRSLAERLQSAIEADLGGLAGSAESAQ